MRKPLTLLSFILFLLLNWSCRKEEIPTDNEVLVSYELIKTLSLDDIEFIRTGKLKLFLQTATLKYEEYANKFEPAKHRVNLFKVTYRSKIPEKNNKPIIASGLIAIPDVPNNTLPMISYQHGTIFENAWAPSLYEISFESQFMISQFASQGYVVIAPDYFGIGGVSSEPQGYFVRYSTEQACLDMYRAALKVMEKENKKIDKFFVSGWSQGAYNSMLFLRRLEQENIPVTAAFTAAAPVDPKFFITNGLFNPRPFDAEFIPAAFGNMIFSFENYYGISGLSEKYIKPEYYNFSKDLYELKISYEAFVDRVPTKPNLVFTGTLYEEGKTGNAPFWEILSTSEAYKWISSTPLRA
jgi:hypothetical protein